MFFQAYFATALYLPTHNLANVPAFMQQLFCAHKLTAIRTAVHLCGMQHVSATLRQMAFVLFTPNDAGRCSQRAAGARPLGGNAAYTSGVEYTMANSDARQLNSAVVVAVGSL